jgi:peptide/nickel transport system substrate-binding protein
VADHTPSAEDRIHQPTIRTFLFADLRGYTRFTQERGDEAAAVLTRRLASLVRATVPDFEGELLELRGDEALCVFGSVRQALRAAVELQRRLRTAAAGEELFPIGVGMGLDAGEAVATEGGYRGAALNLASRLCAIAGPGEILTTEGVAHLAGHVDGVRLVAGRTARLKGVAAPVRVIEVSSETPLPAPPSHPTRRPRRARLMIAISAAAFVAAAAVVAGTLYGRDSAAALAANAVAALNGSGAVASQVVLPLGGRPAGIAAGSRGIWVSDAVHGTVVEVDSTSHTIADTVSGAGTDPAGVAVGGGGVWVADSGGGAVEWVNETSPGTPRRIRVGQGPGPLAYGLGGAWVVNRIDGTLQRIDAGSGFRPSRPVPIGALPTAVAVGGGSVWVTDAASNSVVRVQPGSPGNGVTDRIAVGNDPVAVAFGDGAVWVANAADGTLTRIDPRSDATRTVTVGGRPVGVAVIGASVWVAVNRPDQVVRVDPAGGPVSAAAAANPPAAIVGLRGRPWVVSLSTPASHRGGRLRVEIGPYGDGSPFAAGSVELDPGSAHSSTTFPLLHLTNDGLMAFRQAGGAAGSEVVPDLAVAPPVVSDGGKTYTFRLRRGIRYSNGQPVRPSDFRFAITRQFLDPVSYGWTFFTGLRGASVCQQTRPRCATALAAGIQADDAAGTLALHLVSPDPALLDKLATSFAALLPPDSPRMESGEPVPATGPYMFATLTPSRATLTRNPRFRQWSADAQPAGFPDEIAVSYQPDAGRQLTDVEHGSADVMLLNPPAGRQLELRTTYATLVHPHVQLATDFVAMNTRVPPFANVLARRAVNFAVDRRRIVMQRGGPDAQVPTCQILPPTMYGYRPYCPYTAHPDPAGVWHGPDLAVARRLVRASGTAGDHVDLRACACYSIGRAEVRYLAEVLDRLGYAASVRYSGGYADYSAAVLDSRLPLAVIEGWGADYPYPSNFFDPLLTCTTSVDPGIRFCDRRLDRLLAAAEAAGGGAAGSRAWNAVDREAVDQAPWAPLTTETGVDITGRRVGNYEHNPQDGVLLDQLWVR